MLLVLLMLPCAVLAEGFTASDIPLQSLETIEYLHDVYQLPGGNILLRYYAQDHGDFTRAIGKEGLLYNHCMEIFTPEGTSVWAELQGPYELPREENDQQIIVKPDCFIWEYYPGGSRYDYCQTAYGFEGQIKDVVLDLRTRDAETAWEATAHYTLGIACGDMTMALEVISLTTGTSVTLPVDVECVFDTAEIAGQLALLVRGEGAAAIRFYDENLQEVRLLETPIGHGELVKMASRDGKLYCFAMYAGDWESYYVYTCDLATGVWAEDRVYVALPNEYCGLMDVIPCGEGFLLLVNEGDTQEHPAPFGPYNWNYTDKNLYAMAADGSLSLAMDLNGDARLLPRTDEDAFTLLMRGENNGQYMLRTFTLDD